MALRPFLPVPTRRDGRFGALVSPAGARRCFRSLPPRPAAVPTSAAAGAPNEQKEYD